ncbi:MAG: hypothetical protein WA061_01885 [Microgenomates group bacterium]
MKSCKFEVVIKEVGYFLYFEIWEDGKLDFNDKKPCENLEEVCVSMIETIQLAEEKPE